MTIVPTPAPRKAKKRADGEGNIKYREARKAWVARLMVGTRPDGKTDVREVWAKSQADCRKKLDALKTQAASGTLSSADLAGLTVSAFLDRWLATVKPNLRPKT
jgi:hypothetical protein